MKSRTVLAAGGLLALGVVGSLWLVSRPERPPEASPEIAAGEASAPAAAAELVPIKPAPRTPEPPREHAGGFLERYFGAEWPARKSAYEGLDLAAPLPADFQPWDAARPEIQAAARSYYERDRSLHGRMILSRFEDGDGYLTGQGVSEADLAGVRTQLKDELADVDAELEQLERRFLTALDAAATWVFARPPERYPLADLRAKEKQEGDFNRIYVEKGGWYAVYHFNLNDFPELAALLKEKDPLVSKRVRRLTAFLKKHQAER